MLQSYFDYIFVNLRQKARLRPELSPKLLSTWGANPAQTQSQSGPNLTQKAWLDLQLLKINLGNKINFWKAGLHL